MKITGKLDKVTVSDPLKRSSGDDPWGDFRDIALLDLGLEFRFTHSLGKVSRFFLELEKQRLLGTRCERCSSVWMPPRALCANDGCITQWVEVAQHGTLAVGVVNTHAGGADDLDPLVQGYVALQGVSTLLFQRIRNIRSHTDLVAGLALQVVWSKIPVDHPMESFWFEPWYST